MKIFSVAICNAGYWKFQNNLFGQCKYLTMNTIANNKLQKVEGITLSLSELYFDAHV